MNSGAAITITITSATWMFRRRFASAAPPGMVCTASAMAATVAADSCLISATGAGASSVSDN
jgi:hypothetical protein